ncbi:MAG: NAD(P)-binding domain-containing protein [Sandaracinaceae bacterium]|nr:NAD(P)-binding domain-containing protein [Sandaracinaceae bacterium]
MERTDVVVIGAGQAGLAMSYCLGARGIDHVVLERGRVAERWRSERWDSLRLLTPNWQSRLPGFSYRGDDPDGFMRSAELVSYLERYARSFSAPVRDETAVRSVEREGARFVVRTDGGTIAARSVVIATGACDVPSIPSMAARLSPSLDQIVPARYRRPDQLRDGGVLVVGASATGVQIAHEVHRSGRPVTLAVGRHTRLPRRYRGRDIFDWLERTGALAESADEVYDLEASRRQPSLQLVGRPDHRSIDLGVLQAEGVRLVGRGLDADGTRVRLADDLPYTVAASERKLRRLLERIDHYVMVAGLGADVADPEPLAPIAPAPAPDALDLEAAGIRTVVWATGFRREYPWLKVRVLDSRGELRHRGGVTPVPGLYAIGLPFMRRRSSTFIDGVGADAEALASEIASRLSTLCHAAA